MTVYTHSLFSRFSMCPKSWSFRFVEDLVPKKRSLHLDFGSMVHKGLESFYKGDGDPVAKGDEYADGVRKRAEETGIALADDHALALRMGRAYLEAYLANYRDDLEKFRIVTVEPTFSLVHPDAKWLTFEGKVDLVACEKGSGRFLVWEHKTVSSWDEDVNRLMLDPQISRYAWAWSKMLKIDEVEFLYNIVKKPSIKVKEKESEDEYVERLKKDLVERKDFYFIRTRVIRSKREIETAEREILAVAENVRRLTKHPELVYRSPGEHCFWRCGYREVCIEDTAEMRAALYEHSEEKHPELHATPEGQTE